MKPISLTIDGINSFYERQTVDFDFDGLFCICGNTGSGKTTILDCIIIALYGNGKRSSSLNDYINLRRNGAEIRFVFETSTDDGKQRFEVIRTLKRSGNNKAVLKNITTGETVAEQTESVNKAIENLTMLRREDFTQVVILEQGKFSKFLSATKKERNDTVGNLFRLNKYKELGPRFNKRKELAKRDYDYILERINELSDVTLTSIKEKEKELNSFKTRLKEIDSEQDSLSLQIEKLNEIKRRFDKCVEAQKNLELEKNNRYKLGEELKAVNEEYRKIVDEIKETDENKTKCEKIEANGKAMLSLIEEKNKRAKALDARISEWRRADEEVRANKVEYDQHVEKARKTHSMLDSCVNDVFLIADLGEKTEYYDIIDIKSEAEKLVLRIDNAKSAYDEAIKTFEECKKRYNFDNATLLASMERLKTIKDSYAVIQNEVLSLKAECENYKSAEAVHYLRQTLKEGDECPVCGGIIKGCHVEIAAASKGSLLEAKERELASVEEQLKEIEKHHYSFATRLDESAKTLNEASKRKSNLKNQLDEEMSKILLPKKIDALVASAAKACELQKSFISAQNAAEMSKQKLEAAIKRSEEIKKLGQQERAELTRLEEKLNNDFNVTAEEMIANENNLIRLRTLAESLNDKKIKCEAERDGVVALLGACNAKIELYEKDASDLPQFDPNSLQSKIERLENSKAQKDKLISLTASCAKDVEALKLKYEQKKEFDLKRAEKKKQLDIFSELYSLFSGDKFIEFIAEEYILQFTLAASDVLNEITGGKYTLEYTDGNFYVKDFLSGGILRKADTLSGGETFLASLSLAIAISREIARFKSYEFFFLDEGFGTLDADFIDTVMDALTSLSKDTLVGVVTHRSELTERIFDKIIVLPANGEKGSIIVRS